jgi:3-mercaptopyruvate sulfurtransferase SseA
VGKRLALLGIDPQVPVEVLVSPGDRGGGDAAVAWALAWLGIRKIRLRSIQGLKLSALPEETARANRMRFRPELNLDWVAEARELKASEGDLGGVRVIDVRTPKEYFARKKSGEFRTPDERVVNIPWHEFFDDRGLPRREMIRQLEATGFKRDQRLLVISERGRRSAAVTFALRELGFARAANVLVGWRGVLDAQESGG